MAKENSPDELDRNKEVSHNGTADWANLPEDIVCIIASDLEIIDLLKFQSVCKHWNYGSSSLPSKFRSIPWLLTYGTSEECSIVTFSGKTYTIRIPELEGADCIASNNGWLLFYKEGSVFFYCPFSRAKIDLPKFPCLKSEEHIAAFSSPPTSDDCIVCVLHRVDKTTRVLSMLQRGCDEWEQRDFCWRDSYFKSCKLLTYVEGKFHFIDEKHHLVTHSFEDNDWKCYDLLIQGDSRKAVDQYPLYYSKHLNEYNNNIIKNLDLEDGVSVSTCGTVTMGGTNYQTMIYNVSLKSAEEDKEKRCVKAVWFHPHLLRIPPNYKWSS